MTFGFDTEEMEQLMKAFYEVSGIRLVLFDPEFNEVTAYPREGCRFCRMMKACGWTRRKCNYADRQALKKSAQNNAPVVYKCHAGLLECVIPLLENEKAVGYLMFGQIYDSNDKSELYEKVSVWCERLIADRSSIISAISDIEVKTKEQIDAAAKIMEACTAYIIYKELITPENNKIFDAAISYIEDHLDIEIDAHTLCSELGISRTKLYEIFRSEINMGISKYIQKRRMHRAKKLLKTTDMTIAEIADAVGFSDYNYFSRIYKKTYGKSPGKYR